MAKKSRRARKKRTKQNRRQVIQIAVLPDDVLLEIFDFYMIMHPSTIYKTETEVWRSLVHVCRRWRNVVFRSSRRLNLQLLCTPEILEKDTLNVWPAFPLIILGHISVSWRTVSVLKALGQINRVREVILYFVGREMEQVLAAMRVPYPELTALAFIRLRLRSHDETLSVNPIPDSFLGGSAPRLRTFDLDGIPFPALPKLLLSATHLVYLRLSGIPHSGYIPPEAIVSPLSVLSSLEVLILQFQSPQSRPHWGRRHPPRSKRSILPALRTLYYKGVTEYLEELVTRIETPRLDLMRISFFNQIGFDIPRLAKFINCTPTLWSPDKTYVRFNDSTARVELRYRPTKFDLVDVLMINISCAEPDWQLSSIEQVCSSSLCPLSKVEDLYIQHEYSQLVWKDGAIENTLWMGLLLPFTAVKNLYLSKEFAPGIAAALQELVGGITDVLPSLQNIFVEGLKPSGPLQEIIAKFVAARQLSGHSIGISVWDDSDGDSVMAVVNFG